MRLIVLLAFSGYLAAIAAAAGHAAGDTAAASGPRFDMVRLPASVEPLRDGLQGRDEGVWLDGDVLWLAKRSADGPWSTVGGVAVPLRRVGDSDVWAAGLRWDRWPEAILRVAFVADAHTEGEPTFLAWRGLEAPTEPARAEPGLIATFTLPGPIEEADRSITVVLPPDYQLHTPLPTLVLADGQSAASWGEVIAGLSNAGRARPVAIVGVHSGGYTGDSAKPYDPALDLRAREYLEGFDRPSFDAHLEWIVETVLPTAAARYPISHNRDDLAVAGFSNGGSFAAAAALRRDDVFAASLALSIGVPPEVNASEPPTARFFLAAGVLEHRFLEGTSRMHDELVKAGGTAFLETFVGGHDQDLWTLALSHYLPTMFPPEPAGVSGRDPK